MTKNVHEIITRKQMYMTKLPSMTSGRRTMRALIKNFLKVYDKTFKRRSHFNVAEDTESNYTTGNIFYNVFQRASFCRRSVTDAPAITFSTFKGPINCNEKKTISEI